MLTDELTAYLFDGQPNALAAPMGAWLASSRRFTAFVTDFRTKIRKKVRAAREAESLLDLQLELETARLLLQERALSLAYEPQLGGKSRGPDFAVSFTTRLGFMLEVTRLRTAQDGRQAAVADRFGDLVCGKLGQFLPQRANILLVGAEPPGLTDDDLRAAMLQLQQRAEHNDPVIVQRYEFRDRAGFFHAFQRLSEVIVRRLPSQAGEPAIAWVNPQAKYALPAKVRTTLHRSQSK